LSYYNAFVKKYPTVQKLAKAQEQEVLKLWQGLGYYSRARNLHASAKIIHAKYNGVFPDTYQEIKALKGIGSYTAAAIGSFAFNLPHAVIDGNVYRVLSRVFGITAPIDSTKGKKQFEELAQTLLNKKNPALYNQAIMEFGSQMCKPVNPDCLSCVLKSKCFAFEKGVVAGLPVKEKKTKIRERYFNYFLLIDKKGDVIYTKRGPKDIWQGLNELFLIETTGETDLTHLLKNEKLLKVIGKNYVINKKHYKLKHILSHQRLNSMFYLIKCNKVFGKDFNKIHHSKIHQLAWPRLIDKFLGICTLG
ncbi:MAG: A/G-specific adenine glycosylase, partial [Bacteroidia bacterium]|nr:A/G-specific adenine glycosylase [Bacteroidia bacterium]